MNYVEHARKIFPDRKRINTKERFYTLQEHGVFWNRAKVWNSYQELTESNWSGRVCMRSIRGSRNKPAYNILVENIPKKVREWKKRFGITEEEIRFNESMPDDKLILQGELCENPANGRFWLRYSTVKKPMLTALMKNSKNLEGLAVSETLRKHMWSSDFEEIKMLAEMFPHNVIEFSSYSCEVGQIPGRNTVIWEVRNY
ncbi:MAG: hypothetical protein U9Q06_02305 [Nanoarchaeota archaeon]|nr:hypothetical protein [Nanoarchaeota archaeon]